MESTVRARRNTSARPDGAVGGLPKTFSSGSRSLASCKGLNKPPRPARSPWSSSACTSRAHTTIDWLVICRYKRIC